MKHHLWISLSLVTLLLVGSYLGLRNLKVQTRVASDNAEPIVVLCAAANRATLDEIIRKYHDEFQRDVQVEYGASQTLLSNIEVSGRGDLFIPSDSSFMDIATEKKLVDERIPIAWMTAVLAVPKGNPKSIRTYDDLLRTDIRLVQASPDAAAIGQVTRTTLNQLQKWDALQKTTRAFRGTVTDVANDVRIGAADVGIVYDAVLSSYPELEAIRISELETVESGIEVGVLSSTTRSQSALHFARYLSAKDRGLLNFAKNGYQVFEGDIWADQPEITLYAGSMLRPAIEDSISRFQTREGVEVKTIYNGCGILVGQMKTGLPPDAYFACDVEFMKQVKELFPDPVTVSENELVIVVQKGNPQMIQSLKDLAKPGLRVGIGHEKQCAMGWITQVTFKEGGVQEQVMSNVTVQTPTGDLLINQMRSGSLDAAVVYLSNAAGSAEQLDAISIQGMPCSTALQPWAVFKDTKYPQTTRRLFQAITSPAGQSDFLAEGFGWRIEP